MSILEHLAVTSVLGCPEVCLNALLQVREGLEIVSKPLEKIHVAQKSYRIVTPLLPDELWYIV